MGRGVRGGARRVSALRYRVVGKLRGAEGCTEVGPTFLHGEHGESLVEGKARHLLVILRPSDDGIGCLLG